jgi:hypothetical protein
MRLKTFNLTLGAQIFKACADNTGIYPGKNFAAPHLPEELRHPYLPEV